MNRRRFLSACLATFTSPAIVRASSLMPVKAPLVGDLIRQHFGYSYSFDPPLVIGTGEYWSSATPGVIIRSHADSPETIRRMTSYLRKVYPLTSSRPLTSQTS